MSEHKVALRFALADGKEPFTEWINGLKDQTVRARIRVKIDRVALGNTSGLKSLSDGLYELKMKFGAGYRVYFGYDGPKIIILLSGGDKSSRDRDVKIAKEYWHAYKKTKKA
jgi:putative addiction module killer protein